MCILVLTSKARPQKSLNYSCKSFGTETGAIITLYSDRCYSIFLEEEFSENGYYYLLFSHGSYTVNSDTIVLTDSVDKYVCKFIDYDTYLFPIQSFIFFKNKKFIKEFHFYDHLGALFQGEKRTFSMQQKREFKFFNYAFSKPEGTYTSGYTSQINYNLKLYREGIYKKYLLFYNNKLLSSGQWFNNGNRIGLYDTAIKHTFYFMSADGGVINLAFPPIPETYRGFWKKK